MSEAIRDEPSIAARGDGNTSAATPAAGVSPYATGGGGVTFERKVAVQYLAHLLTGDGAAELGDARCVVSVAFQQAPAHPVDDLVVHAARSDEREPSLVLALAVRRSPDIVSSDAPTRRLIQQFVRAVIDAPMDIPESRLGLVVAGQQPHAEQLVTLATHAAAQMDAPGFFDLIYTPGKFAADVRRRLTHLEQLVEHALRDLGEAVDDPTVVQYRTWQMLSALTVLMPRLASPDEKDWADISNSLIPVARGTDLLGASRLRDRLVDLAAEYSPKSARIDLTLLRRDTHANLEATIRRDEQGWRLLDGLQEMALASASGEIVASDGARSVHVDRRDSAAELLAAVGDAAAAIVTGEPGVGKSSLALQSCTEASAASPDIVQVLCINLRHVPSLMVDFESALGCPLAALLGELSAPQRILVVDGADAATEGRGAAFRHLVGAARASDVKVIAVCAVDSKQVVQDALIDGLGSAVKDHVVPVLTDAEITDVVGTFPELAKLDANPRSRELLRRLVVVDLLVRGRVSGVPMTDADAMNEVWQGLVRRRGSSDRGSPDAREFALLRLADLELGGGDRLDALIGIDSVALDGLRHDGLLRTPIDDRFRIGPEFAHDEVRRYAVARLLLANGDQAARLLQAEAPRWCLSAAQLACQAWLGWPDTATAPVRGRFAELQTSYDAIVTAGHGTRWADVPTEALLTLADSDAVLADAWPRLRAHEDAGLRRLARLVNHRHRDNTGIVSLISVEPITRLLLEEEIPWRVADCAHGLLRDWLYAHIAARTPAGHPLRVLLRERLIAVCEAADRRLAEQREAEAAAQAARTPEQDKREGGLDAGRYALLSMFSYGQRRERPRIPYEITEEIILELLALLGPDLGTDGEEILRRVGRDAPDRLAPAVDDLSTAHAVARYSPGLLAELTEAYYIDDEPVDLDGLDDGIRRHRFRGAGLLLDPAWNRGPFYPLLLADFTNGVTVINRLLKHAARVRALTRTSLGRMGTARDDAVMALQFELGITGTRRVYVGDDHVWRWYRGTGVGPDPCISALQALERVCDERIKAGDPLKVLVSILLEGCENLAMVGLVVGILIRHVEDAGRALDAFLTEPRIWELEVPRLACDHSAFDSPSEEDAAPERRGWSLQHAAGVMVGDADDDRVAELRALGEAMVENARRMLESTRGDVPPEADDGTNDTLEQELATFRNWASSLDRAQYRVIQTPEGLYAQATPPQDVAEILQQRAEERRRGHEEIQLLLRYGDRPQESLTETIGPDELLADIAIAQRILADQSTLIALHPWDPPAMVAAATLQAHLLRDVNLPVEALAFAANTVLRVGEGEAWPRPYETETTPFEQGADRNAARTVSLLLLPAAAHVHAIVDGTDGQPLHARARTACLNLAGALSCEVRLHLARGLDHLWTTPCADQNTCHHEAGLQIATETMRDCALGPRDRDQGQRDVVALDDPIAESLAEVSADSIIVLRLDAAIRSLAPAATAKICVSAHAKALLITLLAAQRRALLNAEHGIADERGMHTLVSARALLTLAEHGDDTAVYTHIDDYADNAFLLGNLLRTLSAAAEETAGRAATARRIWPSVMRHVLALHDSGHTPFEGGFIGSMTRAALIPVAAHEREYRYREVHQNPITWWDPLALRGEVESWLPAAEGNADCVDHLIAFLGTLSPEDQARTGLPWVARLVLADPNRVAKRSLMLSTWLIDIRADTTETGLSAQWQEVVDALVVAGVGRLAPYSE